MSRDPRHSLRLKFAFSFALAGLVLGIGLAVVKRILDDHGFAVEVESPGGKGTTIRVRMPTYEGAPESVRITESASLQRLKAPAEG